MKKQAVSSVSADIAKQVKEAQRLIAYIAQDGNTLLSEASVACIVDAKYALQEGRWDAQQEQKFLMEFDKISASVYPVTIERIESVMPQDKNNAKQHTKAERAVAWYRRYTLVALTLLLLLQFFWLMGHELRTNLNQIFSERETLREQQLKAADETARSQARSELTLLNQKLDANYKLLMQWNFIWSFGYQFDDSLPQYFQKEYEIKMKQLLDSANAGEAENKLFLEKSLHQARILFFEHLLAADFVLNAFQGYLLPLIYGLLGAFIFVLRSLLLEIKSLTYAQDSDVRYRLRLTLGALGGMIVGWFLKPEEAGAMASLSPMALAFMMGYNVDVLFSMMDKIVDNLRQPQTKPPVTPVVSQEQPKPAASS